MAENRQELVDLDMTRDREVFIRDEARLLLRTLREDSRPLWGTMTAQHMVEHLLFIMDNMLGRNEIELLIPEEKLPRYKAFLMSSKGFMRNFKFPLLPETGLPPLKYPSLAEAVEAFEKTNGEVMDMLDSEDFDCSMHPYYGEMNREESIMFHYKHLTHHLMQFGLVPVPGQ